MAKSIFCHYHKVRNGAVKIGARHFRLKAGASISLHKGNQIRVCKKMRGRKPRYVAIGHNMREIPLMKQRKGYKNR